MKKYRTLVPIVLIVLMFVSWYKLVSNVAEENTIYNDYLTAARKYADDGITKYAIENYNLALGINDNPDIYVEVAEYYKSQGKDREYLSWCEKFFEKYPMEAKAYDCVLSAYLADENYESCYDVIEIADKRNISSEFIEQTKTEIKYVYKLDFNSYEDVGVYSNCYCAIKNDGYWGFVDRFGVQRVGIRFSEAGAFTKSGLCPVVDGKGEAYFIDASGEKVLKSQDEYESFGLLTTEATAAKRSDGKYVYVDKNLNKLFGEYDYASTMNNGIAAVMSSDKWSVINSNGEKTVNETFTDIKLDERYLAYCNDRLFVKRSNGKYIMIDSSGKQVGSDEFEDVKVFAGESPSAVKIRGKWQFISKDGKLISEKTYDEARPFCNGLAAVNIDGKWGFIDESENVVIEPQFYGAKDFNEKGSCFVKTGDKWQLLKLYRLNR